MYAVLGDILFEILTSPSSFESVRTFNYAEHRIVQDRPRLEWISDALETIVFDLMLHAAFTNPKVQLDALTAAGRDHQARALLFGNGIHRGYFVLTSLTEVQQHCADDGSVIWATVRVELKEYAINAFFDSSILPTVGTSPIGIVPGVSNLAGLLTGGGVAFDSNQPLSPANPVPGSAILVLGALPAVTYTAPEYASKGVSSGVTSLAGATSTTVSNYAAVPAAIAVRQAP
jgi:phage protein U